MATGLTFGSIAAPFGLTHGLIDTTQYTELVTVVRPSAFVPTLTAQQLFPAHPGGLRGGEALGEEDLSIIHHQAQTRYRIFAHELGPGEVSLLYAGQQVAPLVWAGAGGHRCVPGRCCTVRPEPSVP